MSGVSVLFQIAARNIFANFLNFVIGGIILVGTMTYVMGSSFLNSIDSAMSRSIVGSVGGHLQVYSSKSKDELSVFNSWTVPDLALIPDFSKVKKVLLSVKNVKSIVPMGINNANVLYGNTVDQALEKLRLAVNKKLKGDRSEDNTARIESLKSHLRQILTVIQADYGKLSVIRSEQSQAKENAAALTRAAAPEFWAGFDADPLAHLEFLENRIASLVPDADFINLSYVGTDLDAFQKSFDRMQVVDGEMIPSGRRGILLSKYLYEHQFKLKAASRLDEIDEAVTEKGKKIAKDPDLRQLIRKNRTQTREIILQLDPLSTKKAVASLQKFLGTQESELGKLLPLFFDLNDENFAPRYKFFYAELAPLIELYRMKPGDTLTIKAFTKTGFIKSINIKIYGTFQFKGLEKSGLAGSMSLMDLMSFRDLYGFPTPDQLEETKQLQKTAGAKIVDRGHAEDELFGSGAQVVTNTKETRIDDQAEIGQTGLAEKAAARRNRSYTQDEIDQGVAINAAIILEDPTKLKETLRDVEEASKANGLDLKVMPWQKAAGQIGQFALVAKIILYLAVFIIFIVGLVVINNAVMMATVQRTREIGTMRAIGAQRSFVLSLLLAETVALGLVFGSIGTVLGALGIQWLGHHGIPAGNEFLYFFFSGPRLYPFLSPSDLVGAFLIIMIVTTVSALYPAIIAARVSPIEAMQAEE